MTTVTTTTNADDSITATTVKSNGDTDTVTTRFTEEGNTIIEKVKADGTREVT